MSNPLKRPRGRPKGSRTKPRATTIAEFVQVALADHQQPPPPVPKPKSEHKGGNGIWSRFKTPEERQAYARYLATLRKPENMARTKRRTGTPNGWTGEAAREAKARAEIEAAALVQRLKAAGTLPKDDPELASATQEALAFIRAPGGPVRRRKVAAQLMTYFHPETASDG